MSKRSGGSSSSASSSSGRPERQQPRLGRRPTVASLQNVQPAQPPKARVGDKDLTSFDQFKKRFNPKDYIEALSRRLVYNQQSDKPKTGPAVQDNSNLNSELFDPKPFQDVFDSTLQKLLALRDECDSKMRATSKNCDELDAESKKRIAALRTRFDSIFFEFRGLDMTITKISTNAVRTGTILEGVDTQRERAVYVKEYFDYIIELNDQNADIEGIFGDLNDMEAAKLLKHLVAISQELDMSHTKWAKTNIEKKAADLEASLLSRFQTASRDNKFNLMNELASIWYELNGGDNCVKEYINQLAVFLSPHELDVYNIVPLPEPPAPPPDRTPKQIQADREAWMIASLNTQQLMILESNIEGMKRFFAEVLKFLKAKFEDITRIFPAPQMVFQRLVEQVFVVRIGQFARLVLEQANMNKNMYLGTFHGLVDHTNHLITDCMTAPLSVPGSKLAQLAEQVYHDHTNDYLPNELATMKAYFDHEKKASSQKKEGFFSTEWEPMLTPELTFSCFDRFRDAMKRCGILSHPGDMATNYSAIFLLFLKEFGSVMTLSALDYQISKLVKNAADRVEPFLELVQAINSNVVLIENHFLDVRVNIEKDRMELERCITEKNTLLQMLEDKIAQGLEKTLTAAVATAKALMKKHQFSSDFNPSPRDAKLGATKACTEVCKKIKELHQLISRCLDGGNVDVVLFEFGRRVLEVIQKHIRKFTIETQLGTLILVSDLTQYQQAFSLFKLPKLDDYFEVLRPIGKLFMVAPEQLGDLIRESSLAKVPQKELETYIKRRSDYNSSWLNHYY